MARAAGHRWPRLPTMEARQPERRRARPTSELGRRQTASEGGAQVAGHRWPRPPAVEARQPERRRARHTSELGQRWTASELRRHGIGSGGGRG